MISKYPILANSVGKNWFLEEEKVLTKSDIFVNFKI